MEVATASKKWQEATGNLAKTKKFVQGTSVVSFILLLGVHFGVGQASAVGLSMVGMILVVVSFLVGARKISQVLKDGR